MKKVVALVALIGCMGVGSISFGQDNPALESERSQKSPADKAAKLTAKMTEDLQLTESQAKEVKVINESHIQEMEVIKRKMKALKDEARALRESHQAEVDNVLTDEQKKLHAEKRAERKSKKNDCKKECDKKRG